MNDETFIISFPDSTDADANIHARSLADDLKTDLPADMHIIAEPHRSNPEAQDFGATLAVVLGTAAATQVAKGVHAWLRGHTGVTMEIHTSKGEIVLRNAESKSAADIAKAFSA